MKTSSFRDLKVWQKAMDLTTVIYELVRQLPREELFALSDQMRRAVVSVPSNIAEGHGRESDKEFVKFLLIAKGSLHELETQLEICIRLQYLSENQIIIAHQSIIEITKMLNSLIAYRRNLKSNF